MVYEPSHTWHLVKWSWAVPERSGDVPGGSRARIIDFSLVFEGFGGGGRGRAWARFGRGVWAGPPKLKEKHQKTKLELECLVFTRYRYRGLWCLVLNPRSRRRAERGGGYLCIER